MIELTRGEFFELLFQELTGYLCLASIVREPEKQFEEAFFEYPRQLDEAEIWIEDRLEYADLYFCPHLLAEPKRRKELALPGYVSWAELDECQPDSLGKYGEALPQVVIQTSPGRWQAYWLFSEITEPALYEEVNRRLALAYKDEGCDQGGWDLTQLMRIPGTRNYKREELWSIPRIFS